MARPRKGAEKIRTRHIGLRVEPWVHAAVHQLAAEQDQPASDIAHELLEIALGRLGIKPATMQLHINSRSGPRNTDSSRTVPTAVQQTRPDDTSDPGHA